MLKKMWLPLKRWIAQTKSSGKFFAYFIVGNMFVAGLFGTLLYVRSAKSLEMETLKANQNMLIMLNRSADLLLSQVDQYLNQLALDQSVADFMKYYKSNDLLTQIKINTAIDNNLLLSRYLNSINIYYFNDNKVYSTNRGVRDLQDFPDREIFEQAQSGQLIYNWLPTRKFYDEKSGKKINVITIVKPIPLGSFEPIAVAVVNIEENYLRDSMNAIITNNQLEILVVDDKTRFISSNRVFRPDLDLEGKPYLNRALLQKTGNYLASVNQEKMLISFVTSETYGWKYISIIPFKVIVEKISFIRNYAIIISMLAIILGLIISLFFSNRIFQPINMIAGLFKDDCNLPEQKDILKYIEKSVNRLVEKNENFEKAFTEHLPVLRNNFLTGFITGSITDKREIELKLKYYGIEIDTSSYFLVYLISLDNHLNKTDKAATERQLNILVIYLMEILNNLPSPNHRKIVVNTKANEIAVVFELRPGDDCSLSLAIEKTGMELQQAVRANVNYTFTIAAGGLKKGVSRIADSYNEALEALHYKVLIGNQKVIRYEDIQNLKEENFEYPYQKERELTAAINQGDFATVERVSREIFDFFSTCSESLGDSLYYYYLQLLGSTIRSALETGVNVQSVMGEANLYQELLKCKGNAEIQDWFAYLFKELTEHAGQRKNTKNKVIIESIVNYIQEHWDQDLSLTTLSQRVFLSVPYLSSVFREEYGKPLKQFINEVRVGKAKEFLADPTYQITKVAEKVGYDKVHAFLRLFKEYTGMTPGQYRKLIALNKNENEANVIQNDSKQ